MPHRLGGLLVNRQLEQDILYSPPKLAIAEGFSFLLRCKVEPADRRLENKSAGQSYAVSRISFRGAEQC